MGRPLLHTAGPARETEHEPEAWGPPTHTQPLGPLPACLPPSLHRAQGGGGGLLSPSLHRAQGCTSNPPGVRAASGCSSGHPCPHLHLQPHPAHTTREAPHNGTAPTDTQPTPGPIPPQPFTPTHPPPSPATHPQQLPLLKILQLHLLVAVLASPAPPPAAVAAAPPLLRLRLQVGRADRGVAALPPFVPALLLLIAAVPIIIPVLQPGAPAGRHRRRCRCRPLWVLLHLPGATHVVQPRRLLCWWGGGTAGRRAVTVAGDTRHRWGVGCG